MKRRQTFLPNQFEIIDITDSIPSYLRTRLTLELGSIDPGTQVFSSLAGPVTYNSADVYGHRLVVHFDGAAVPSLLYDGVTQLAASGAVPAGRRLVVKTSIDHPYPSGGGVDVVDNTQLQVTPASNATFLIGTGWGPTGRGMIEKHRKVLVQNARQSPDDPSAEPVLGESLAMLSYTWLAEHAQAKHVIGQVSGTTLISHHAVGIVGMKPVGTSSVGPFIDLPLVLVSPIQKSARPDTDGFTPIEAAVFVGDTTFLSIAESGAIEQTQPGSVAVSTVKLIDTTVLAGGTIFDINNTSNGGSEAYYESTIRPILTPTYRPEDLNRINDFVLGQHLRVIAPANGTIVVDQFSGVGYFSVAQDGRRIGALISGGLSGGEPAVPVPIDAVVANTPYSLTPALFQSSVITNPQGSWGYAGGFFGVPISWEPINLVTGDYLLSATDLSVGSQGMPYGLAFQRHYDSGTRFQSGPLGPGWSHNFAITALANSDVFEGLGVNSPINGAASIAALFVAWDILNDGSTTAKSLEGIVVASIVQRWLMDQLTGNVVAVTQPGLVEHFVKLADGTYNPPLASGARLTLDNGAYTYVAKDRTTLSFDTNGNLATWRSAAGATITLTYAGSPAKLVSVTNDFRRQLTFTYDSDLLKQVQDDSGRSVSYTYDPSGNLIGFTDTLGNLTSYAYAAPGQLATVVNPSFPSTPFVTNSYDSLGRVMTQTDANGGAWQYFFAGTRSEEVDPKGTRHVLYTTARGRTRLDIQDLDGLNLRTATDYDGRDRPTKTSLPAGNSISYEYDLNSNVTRATRNDKTVQRLGRRDRDHRSQRQHHPRDLRSRAPAGRDHDRRHPGGARRQRHHQQLRCRRPAAAGSPEQRRHGAEHHQRHLDADRQAGRRHRRQRQRDHLG